MDLLLEREGELAVISNLIGDAAAGRGAVVAVSGPAGIGKTSLLLASERRAEQAGLRCLTARGRELERNFSFGVVRQLFERALHDLPPSDRERLLSGSAALAAPLLGLGNPDDWVAGDAFALLHGLYWLCSNLAEQSPLMLAVDDLHWADEGSLRFLAYLQARVSDLPLLVCACARTPPDGPSADLLGELLSRPDITMVPPAGLSERAIGELLEARTGAIPDPGLVRATRSATGGNPFLSVTLAAAIADHDQADGELAAAAITDAARAIAGVVAARLARLQPAATTLVRAISVLGSGTPHRLVLALAGLEESTAPPAHDALSAEQILRPWPALEFEHPLLESAVRESIPPAERAYLHGVAATILSQNSASSERIALQLLKAPPIGELWAVTVLRDAASHALAHGDAVTAAVLLRRALAEPAAEADILPELGAAELHAGDHAEAAEHLASAAVSATDPRSAVRVARDLSQALAAPGNYRAAVDALDAAITALGDEDHDEILRLEGERYQSAMMDPALYAAARGSRIQLDRSIGGATRGERALLTAMATEGCLQTVPAKLVRGWARMAFDRGLLADHEPYASLWGNAAFPLIFADGFEAAADVSAQALEDARRRGSPLATARAFAVSAVLHLRRGGVRDAESDARASAEVGLKAGFAVSLLPLGVLIEALIERGLLDAAERELQSAGRADTPLAPRFLENWILHARGRLSLATGRVETAIADLEELGQRGRDGWRPWNPGMFCYRSDLAMALLRTGARERAEALAAEEVALARQWGTRRAIGIALRAAALTAAGSGIDLLRESVDQLDGSGAVLEHARSLIELGAAIRRTGTRSQSLEPLQSGMDLAAQCGATALAARGREELVAAGSRPRRTRLTGVDALTPSEIRVARLASQGLSNREIAQTLFVTIRTVQVHLTSTYRKLDIESRAQLPDNLPSLLQHDS